jgi:hypothetical protein
MKNPAVIVLLMLVLCIAGYIWYLVTNKKEPGPKTRQEALREIYNKAEKIYLPFEYPSKEFENSYVISGTDTLVFPDGTDIVGALKDTTNFFTFIRIEAGDVIYPVIITVNKNGNIIDEKVFSFEGAPDCGFDYEEKNVLNTDLSMQLYRKDRIQECDDEGPLGPTTVRETTETGQINKSGKIIMNMPVEKEWIEEDSTAAPAIPAIRDSAAPARPARP